MFSSPRKRLATCISLSLSLSFTAFANEAANATTNEPPERILVQGEQLKLEIASERALTPGGVTLIDSSELAKRSVSNLADMLRYVPGVWVASGSTGDSAFFSSRGSNLDATSYDGNGIKLLQDGLPITAADGNNHNRTIDPLSTRYAVVARGANALTYGASTLGGAIDFVSPTAHDIEPLEIMLNAGSHGQLQGRLTAGAVAGNFDGIMTVESRKWDGFRVHQQQQREGLYANAGWQISDDLKTRFYFNYIDNDQELPGALTAEQFAQDPYQGQPASIVGNFLHNVETWRMANKTVWNLNSNSSLTVGISYEEQSLYHPIVYSPYFSLLIDTDQHTTGTSLRYNLRVAEHDLLVGLNYGVTTVKGGNYSHEAGVRQNLMTVVDNDADSLELFLVDRWQIVDKWKLIYGLQLVAASREVRNTNATSGALYNPQADYNSINPRIGLIYQVTENSELFANISRLYEPPTNYELEDDASMDDEALKAMHGKVVEVGTRGTKPFNANDNMNWEFALYYGQLQDEILSIDDPNAPGTSLSSNVDDTIHAGFEALVGASFALDNVGKHRLDPLVSLTINRFSFDNDSNYGNNELPAAPGYAVKGEILYRHANGFFVGPTFDIVDKRYADFSNSYTIDNYTLVGLRIGLSGESWEVFGEARNLTDKEYVSVFSVKDRAAPNAAILQAGEPRSVYFGAKFQF
ncbi:TonB-dependent receptor family protein [Paraglaciecola hydrolytica]|uniref:TonB-dependent receptor n=1 Tax=Paraglaciecola hydrolytica TaxID=1799789 RepID=A0A136A4C4_9ALTE|nr:TonB-dependent receptor [Paraglaciecola hydrolytica]KXI30095.1 TonB-dependent receptor [Paraglaciecola hydrolytica]